MIAMSNSVADGIAETALREYLIANPYMIDCYERSKMIRYDKDRKFLLFSFGLMALAVVLVAIISMLLHSIDTDWDFIVGMMVFIVLFGALGLYSDKERRKDLMRFLADIREDVQDE